MLAVPFVCTASDANWLTTDNTEYDCLRMEAKSKKPRRLYLQKGFLNHSLKRIVFYNQEPVDTNALYMYMYVKAEARA